MILVSLVSDALLRRSLPDAATPPTAILRQRLYRAAVSLVPPTVSTPRGVAELRTRSDEALLAAYLGGDASAFEVLMERHLGWMQVWARQHLPPAEADDATQEAFIALLRKAANLQLHGALRGYLFGLLRIEVLRARRFLDRRRGEPLDDEKGDGGVLVDAGPDPEVALLARRTHEEVADALHRACNLREQEVILFTLEGTDDRTIAVALEISEVNVRVLRHRALGKLRQALGVSASPGRSGADDGR